MRVISGNDSQGVVDAGEKINVTNGTVHFYGLVQGLLCFALMVSVINAPACNGPEKLEHLGYMYTTTMY